MFNKKRDASTTVTNVEDGEAQKRKFPIELIILSVVLLLLEFGTGNGIAHLIGVLAFALLFSHGIYAMAGTSIEERRSMKFQIFVFIVAVIWSLIGNRASILRLFN